MEIYLMRHGEASYDTATDEARPLTDFGLERSRKTGKLLRRLGVEFHAIYASPRVRALQTAECVAESYGLAVTTRPELDFDFDLPRFKALLEGKSDRTVLLLVGHNPSISEVLEVVTGAVVDLGKGAVARVDVHLPAVRGSELKWLMTPKLLDMLGG
jgi:phosphohistidine phosphatase